MFYELSEHCTPVICAIHKLLGLLEHVTRVILPVTSGNILFFEIPTKKIKKPKASFRFLKFVRRVWFLVFCFCLRESKKMKSAIAFLCVLATVCNAFYVVSDVEKTVFGIEGHLQLAPGSGGPFGSDLEKLAFRISAQTDSIIRVQIVDEAFERWQVPYLNLLEQPTQPVVDAKYSFSYTESPFGFAVSRIADGAVLFNSTPAQTDDFPALIVGVCCFRCPSRCRSDVVERCLV
jgi:hypothetical protein